MDNEEYKSSTGKKLIVPIIAIALFMVLVFGATYAYFGASITNSNVSNAKAVLPNVNTVFTVTGNTCSFTVDASDMVQSANSNTEAKANATCNITASLTAALNVLCSYDIFAVETTADYTNKHYQRTSGLSTGEKEFTGQVTVGSNVTADNSSTSELGMENYSSTEKKIGHGILTGSGSSAVTSKTELTIKWYNAAKDQAANHKGKTYTYEMRIKNVVC